MLSIDMTPGPKGPFGPFVTKAPRLGPWGHVQQLIILAGEMAALPRPDLRVVAGALESPGT